jgi:Lon protease-like protein
MTSWTSCLGIQPAPRVLHLFTCVLAIHLTVSVAHAQTARDLSAPAAATLPATIPILPLPAGVLFPNVSLPIRIVEPRYRTLIEDALAGDRIVGVVLQRSAFDGGTTEEPAMYAIGTAGVITSVEPLTDGRLNIVLRGTLKFRLAGTEQTVPYSRARVEVVPEAISGSDTVTLAGRRARLEELATLATGLSPARLGLSTDMSDADVVHTLAFRLDFDPFDSQALLERNGVLARADALIELLETNTALPR